MRRLAVPVLVAGLALSSLVGCGVVPPARGTAEEPWKPATEKSLGEWAKLYDKTVADALAKKQPDTAKTVTAGVLQHAVKARVAFNQKGGEEQKAAPHGSPKFYLPKFQDYPLWGVMKATDGESGDVLLDLITRQTAGENWRSLLSVQVPKDRKVPEFVMEGGVPVEEPLNDKEGTKLQRPPGQTGRAFAKFLTATSPSSPYATFNDEALTRSQLDTNIAYEAARKKGQLTVEHETKPAGMRALRTQDGRAVLLIGVREHRVLKMRGGYRLPLDGDSPERILTGKTSATKSVQSEIFWQAAILLEPKGTDAKSTLLGVSFDVANAKVT